MLDRWPCNDLDISKGRLESILPQSNLFLEMKGKNQFVVRRGKSWAVRGAHNSKATKLFETQRDAIDFGIDIARNQGSELRIQGRNGKFRESRSYGDDP